MSEIAHDAAPAVKAGDERIGFRGPIQRLLVSPEIGAVIGAVLVWAFFWGNGRTFGTAATTLNVLDTAAPLGIMAVVVALLMIGGEFDLSSGMMTGATGILSGLMAKYFMGDGAPMWLAIVAAFLVAGAVGWFNGTVVNRTGLPSFIVTLAAFFTIKGILLVVTKRLEGKVQVADVEKAKGFKFFEKIFAHQFKLENFGSRNGIFVGFVLAGAVLLAIGLCEQSFIRRAAPNTKMLPVALAGIVAAVGGFVMLNKTDGVSNNAIFGVLCAAGVIAAVGGGALVRYQGSGAINGAASADSPAARNLALVGLGAAVLTCIVPLALDRKERREILTWFPSWLRVVAAVAAAATGVALVLRHIWPGLRERFGWHRPIQAFVFAAYAGLLLAVLVLSFLQLATVQAMRAIAMVALAALAFATLLRARARAGKVSHRQQLIIGLLTALALGAVAFVVRGDSGAIRFRTGLFTALIVGAVLIAANSVLEATMIKRSAADAGADKRGRRLVAGGALLAAAGLVIRVIFTNVPSALAKKGDAITIVRMSVVWWIIITLIGAFVLTKTKWGNWIFAVGGNKDAARAIGVPANRVKTGLFVTVSLVGAFVGVMTLLRYTSVQANQGDGQEFLYIIAAVVGGNLLTGGYGSVIGASVGALIIAMSNTGIGSARWNQDGKFAFQGAVLLIAVLVNNYTRKKAQEAR